MLSVAHLDFQKLISELILSHIEFKNMANFPLSL